MHLGAASLATTAAGGGFVALRSSRIFEPETEKRARFTRDYGQGLERPKGVFGVGAGGPEEATRAAIEAVGGMKSYVRPGETVAIKPNIGWDRAPIHAANTNPIVVSTLVTLCLEAGAARVIVTDNSCNEARRSFTRSGIWKAASEAGAEVILPAPHRFRPYDLGGRILHRMPIFTTAVNADRFINVPIAKHHGLSGMTGAMKNLYGLLGGRRNRLHQSIDASIADLADFLRATLTVLDATRVLLRNGPQGGDIADTQVIGKVVASVDPVAVDAYAAGLLGLTPEDLPFLDLAARRGLGHINWQSMDVRGS